MTNLVSIVITNYNRYPLVNQAIHSALKFTSKIGGKVILVDDASIDNSYERINTKFYSAIKNGKCLADALGTIFVVPGYSFMYSGKCSEFKEKEYFVNIQKTFNARPEPMVGAGNSPKNMIDYYYNQAVPQNVGAQ